MKKEQPFCNKLIYRREQQKMREMLSKRITKMKFSNFSAFKIDQKTCYTKKVRSVDVKTPQNIQRPKLLTQNSVQFKIRQENKFLFDKLVNQKSLLSSKTLAIQRLKNVQILNRIGKYPYKNIRSIKTQTQPSFDLENEHQQDQKVHTRLQKRHSANIQVPQMNETMIDLKRNSIAFKLAENNRQKKQIVLWNKIIELNKIQFWIKIIRYKMYYHIELKPVSLAYMYTLNLSQNIGTELLTKYDYNYQLICQECLKIQQKKQIFTFCLDEIRHQLRFHHKQLQYQENIEQRIVKQRSRQNSLRSKEQFHMVKPKDDTTCMIQETDQDQELFEEQKVLNFIKLQKINLSKRKKK